jgi:serine protease Do
VTRRPIRRLAWALLLGGGISLAFGAGGAEDDNYFDPLPKSGAAARKAAEKERARKERAEKERIEKERAEARRAEQERADRERRAEEESEREARTHEDEEPAPDAAPEAADGAGTGAGAEATEEEDTYFSLPAPPEKAAPRRAPPAAASEDAFADVAERVLPSVVSVTRRRGGGGGGLGSGVLAGPPGHVLTSNHVIEGEGALKVRLADGRELDAQRVAADPATDVAVLRLVASKQVRESLRPIRIGDSEALRVGESVAALGSPYGLSETVTTGIVSAKGRRHAGLSEYGRLIQTDAAINPGSSGGPLVNRRGELVGINTAIVSRGGGSQGIGFAIPSNLARKVMDDLLRDGTVSRGWLGV